MNNTKRDYRPRATDFVTFILYLYALGTIFFLYLDPFSFMVGLYHNLESDESEILTRFVSLIFSFLIAIVYIRNYSVMSRIDNRNYNIKTDNKGKDNIDYVFVNFNTGWLDFSERSFRFLIIFTIFWSSQAYGYQYISYLLELDKALKVEIYTIYYSIILIVLFFLFIVYDLINVYSVYKETFDKWKDSCEDFKTFIEKEKNKTVQSYFMYLNYIYKTDTGITIPHDGIGKLCNNYAAKQNILTWFMIYFKSSKFFERLTGILFSILIIVYIIEKNPYFSFLFLILAAIYLYFVRQNNNFFKIIIYDFLCVFSKYFTIIREKEEKDAYQFTQTKDTFKTIVTKKGISFMKKIIVGLILLSVAIYFMYTRINSGTTVINKQVITVWQTESDTNAKAVLNKLEKDFESKYPKVDLKIESISWGNLSPKLNLALRNKNLPDVSHIQPFMAYSLVDKGYLSPITDFVNKLNKQEGGIFPAVKDLQHFNGEYYGIAYAVGTTFWSTRLDKIVTGTELSSIKTWDDYLKFVKNNASENNSYVMLPGKSKFFIDQLYSELLVNAGGILFDPVTFKPLLTSEKNLAVLGFFRDLANTKALAPSWREEGYLAQFIDLAEGKAFSVPVTYARASRTIEKSLIDKSTANPSTFAWLNQPVLKEGMPSIATIDCEPYVIFKVAEKRKGISGKTNKELAVEFLTMFYSKKYYTEFTNAVPVHLTPIFKDMANSDTYLNAVGKWKPWHDKTIALINSDNTRPILMPDTREEARKIPFLLDFQANNILSDAVNEAISSQKDLKVIAEEAQIKAEELWQRYKK